MEFLSITRAIGGIFRSVFLATRLLPVPPILAIRRSLSIFSGGAKRLHGKSLRRPIIPRGKGILDPYLLRVFTLQ